MTYSIQSTKTKCIYRDYLKILNTIGKRMSNYLNPSRNKKKGSIRLADFCWKFS